MLANAGVPQTVAKLANGYKFLSFGYNFFMCVANFMYWFDLGTVMIGYMLESHAAKMATNFFFAGEPLLMNISPLILCM